MAESQEKRFVFSRRALLQGAAGGLFALAAAQVLSGCSGGSGGGIAVGPGAGGGGAVVQQVDINATPPANDAGETHLLTVTDSDGVTTAFFGRKNAGSQATVLTQSLSFRSNASTDGVRTVYDGTGRPVRVTLANGTFYTIAYEASRALFKFYDASGKFLGAAVATAVTSGGRTTFSASALSLPQITGSFEGTLSGEDTGLISFVAGSQTSTARGKTIEPDSPVSLHTRAGARTIAVGAGAVSNGTRANSDAVAALSNLFAFNPLAQNLLNALGSGPAGGTNSLLAALLKAAGATTGQGGAVSMLGVTLGPIASLLGALSSARLTAARLKQIKAALDGGGDLVRDNLGRLVASAPAGSAPIDLTKLVTALPGVAPTAVNGVVVSDLLGIVNLRGAIKPSGDVSLTGNANNGTPFNFTGNIASGRITNGRWGAGARRGTWSSQPARTGQCQTLQTSGGEGKYTKIFDLGRTSGSFDVFYNMQSIPDRMDIFYDGQTLFTTGGLVSGSKTTKVNFNGSQSSIIVVLTAPNDGTAWTYSVSCARA